MLTTLNTLIKTVLTGNRRWEWLPILVARLSLGLFFAVSGYNKLFDAAKHEDLIHLMTDIGIPFPEFMALFLGSVEFFGGLLLLVGLFSTFCAIALTIAMIVAILTVEIEHAIPKDIGFLDRMSWFFYLPQVLYIILFAWLMTTGPGQFSIDHFLANNLGVANDD